MTDGPSSHDPAHESVLDVDVEKLAKIYAQAGLDAAGDHNAQRGLIDELNAIHSEVLSKYRELEKVFDSALVAEHEKLGIIDRVFGQFLSPIALNLLKVMAMHGRLGILRYVIRAANRLWKRRCDQVTVTLELADELDSGLQQEIVSALSKALGCEPIVSVRINSDLIAGFVARVGDRIYDASTRTSLERARQAMVKNAVELIQRQPHHFFRGAPSS